MEKLNSQESTPLYYQLYQILHDKVVEGEYCPGARIPTEKELIDQYSVSRVTVRAAINQLVNEQMLVKIPGKGTFVSSPKIERHIDSRRIYGFSEAVRKNGDIPSARLLDISYVPGTTQDVKFFGIPEGSPLIQLRRLRLINDAPAMIEVNLLPAQYSALFSADLEQSLYENLTKLYNVQPWKDKKTFEISYATAEESSLLDLSVGSPVILSYDYCYDIDGNPVHTCKQIIHGKKFKYILYVG